MGLRGVLITKSASAWRSSIESAARRASRSRESPVPSLVLLERVRYCGLTRTEEGYVGEP